MEIKLDRIESKTGSYSFILDLSVFLPEDMRDEAEYMSSVCTCRPDKIRQPNSLRYNKRDSRACLRPFETMRACASLTAEPYRAYKIFLRKVLWTCFLLCLVNLFMETPSYRNTLFDSSLSMLHLWVCFGEIVWAHMVKTKVWKEIISSVGQSSILEVNILLWRVGIIGWVLMIGACVLITGGWLYPIMNAIARKDIRSSVASYAGEYVAAFIVAVLHGCLMIIIIPPWGCVFLCTVFMFYLYGEGLKSKLNGLAVAIEEALSIDEGVDQMRSKAKNIAQSYMCIHALVKTTSEYLKYLIVGWFVLCFFLLVAAVSNIKSNVRVQSNEGIIIWSHWCQDLFFLLTGGLGFAFIGLVCSSITTKGRFFKERVAISFITNESRAEDLPSSVYAEIRSLMAEFPFEFRIFGVQVDQNAFVYTFLLFLFSAFMAT